MSVQMANKPSARKNFGFFVTEKHPSRRFEPRTSMDKKSQEKAILDNISKHIFPVGVRAPLLTDIPAPEHHGDSSFRFDVVDSMRGPRPVKDQFSAPIIPRKRTPKNRSSLNSSKTQPLISPRTIKFLLSDGSFKDVKHDLVNENEPDAWDQWKENVARAKDARDRMYRNTYCLAKDKMRYHVCTLPRIINDRPWTVGEIVIENGKKNMVLERHRINVLPNQMIVPQPERRRIESIQIKGLQKQNTMDSVTNKDCFEVRRIEASTEFLKDNAGQLTTVVRQPSDLSRIYETTMKNRKLERPLKNENMKYRPAHWGNKVPIRVRKISTQGVLDRDYKSVQAYKEYVELMQHRGVEGKSADRKSVDKESSLASQYGYENRVLQSVIDVNQPDKLANGKKQNSIVVEIKPTWDEQTGRESDKRAPSSDGRLCPVNSPLLATHDDIGLLLQEAEVAAEPE